MIPVLVEVVKSIKNVVVKMTKETRHEQSLKLDMPFNEALERFSSVNIKDITEVDEEISNGKKPTPFVKWVGGKRFLIPELIKRLPKEFNNFYEPFVGGGALFFEIYKDIKFAYLSDINLDLVFAYNVIKKDPDRLIELLKEHSQNHNDDYYYKIRGQHDLQDPIKIVARFLYLNRTCFNGLYRVNKSGKFNVPVGRYKNPNIVQEENIRACNIAFKKAKIEYKTYLDVEPEKNDFVYIDPPYQPTDDTSFTTYTKQDFTEKDQVNLRDYITKLHKIGAKIMLSNSKTKFIEDIYKDKIFNIDIVNAPRFINCKPDGRDLVEEVIIRNYE